MINKTHDLRARLLSLYRAYQGGKLERVVSDPYVRAGYLKRGERRDWLTPDGLQALRDAGYET